MDIVTTCDIFSDVSVVEIGQNHIFLVTDEVVGEHPGPDSVLVVNCLAIAGHNHHVALPTLGIIVLK